MPAEAMMNDLLPADIPTMPDKRPKRKFPTVKKKPRRVWRKCHRRK